MKKNILWMLAAILTCGLTVTAMSACSSDDDDKTEAKAEKEIFYAVRLSDDVLKVADVEVNYVDQTGSKKKETMVSKAWSKTYKLSNSTPLEQGIWAKITPKANAQAGTYLLKVVSGLACKTTLANGESSLETCNSDPDVAPATAKTAEEIAAWCAKSPTSGLLVDPSGTSKEQYVDFGGNSSFWTWFNSWWCVLPCFASNQELEDCEYCED